MRIVRFPNLSAAAPPKGAEKAEAEVMKPKKRPAWTLVPPRDRILKGTVGNNRKAERNVVKVKEQSRKKSGVNRSGRSDSSAGAVAVFKMGPPNLNRGCDLHKAELPSAGLSAVSKSI
jgi:hypothetical protein